jgi:hypothetical protein
MTQEKIEVNPEAQDEWIQFSLQSRIQSQSQAGQRELSSKGTHFQEQIPEPAGSTDEPRCHRYL